jgi:hypothetical protein
VVAGLGLLTYIFGRGALGELLTYGYFTSTNTPQRIVFNEYLRHVTLILGFLFSLVATGFASEGIAKERMQETWLSVVATPMSGHEILAAKRFGGLWRARGIVALILILWTIGLLLGSVHPLGFLAALVSLSASGWFFTSLGTYASLRGTTPADASNLSLLPVLLLDLSGLLVVSLPAAYRTILLGAGSTPLVQSIALLSFADVRRAFSNGEPVSPQFAIPANDSLATVVLTYLLSVVGVALAAAYLDRLANRQFDRLVGRPIRPSEAAPPAIAPQREPAAALN